MFVTIVPGVPHRNGKNHVTEVGKLALDLRSVMSTLEIPHLPGTRFRIRIGVHTGKYNKHTVRYKNT